MKSKGFAALTIVLLSAVLSILSYTVIQYGRISLNVVEEKQSLDSCSVGVGRSIISTNDIESICSSDFLNRCSLFDLNLY